jgi:DNA replication protein
VSFEARSTEDLIRIAEAGAGFRLDATGRSTDDLIRIAAAASSWGVRLLFAGVTDRSTDELVRIAEAGEGGVEFEG